MMVLPNVWPKQRASAKNKTLSAEERAYRERVRANKTKAAVAASNARVSAERAVIRSTRAVSNKQLIRSNEREIEEHLSAEFKAVKVKRRKERNRRWAKILEKAHKLSREAGSHARRRFQRAAATPLWANAGAMLAMYRKARRLGQETGLPHHVDHIVPLISPIVCGLHCEQNMQILPGEENMSKGNRRWPDMP